MNPKSYLSLLKNRDFLLLSVVILVGQVASAFLVLSLIISLYEQTESSFAVSGVIISFTIPGLLLMSVAGLAADVFDRRKIILFANTFIALVVLMIAYFRNEVVGATVLSSLYFAGNTFFLPAASAATAQLAGKRNVLVSNIYFIFTFAGGLILGFLLTSIVTFVWGPSVAIVICLELLILAAFLSFFLPTMMPKKKKAFSLFFTVKDVFTSFAYIFSRKLIWFYFVLFAASQAVIAFAATIAPGFFHEILGFTLRNTMIFVFPLIAIGAVIGSVLIQKTIKKNGFDIMMGTIVLSLAFLIMGSLLKFTHLSGSVLVLLSALFLVAIGVGDLVLVIASRVALQKHIAHNYQGTVFGTNIILASLMSTFFSLLGAQMAISLGFINTIFISGVILAVAAVGLNLIKWRLSD